ncbi:interferon regulatory factor 2-binding protein [Sarotherodon galilaeus]
MAGLCSVTVLLFWAVIIVWTEYPSHAQVIGILGSNITLQFTFNVSITENSQIGIYTTGFKKIDDLKSRKSFFDIYPRNNSVFYHITNLTLSHSNTYCAILFGAIPIKSNEVQLFIEEKNTHSTATETPAEPPQYNSNAVITVIRVFAFITSLALVVGVCKIYHLKCIKSRN